MDTQEENNIIYINQSKQNINNYLSTNNYRSAFGLLILVLQRLDERQKNEFIDYYSNIYLNYNMVSHLELHK